MTTVDDEVEKLRQARMEAQQAAATQETAMQVADTAAKARPENLRMFKDEMEQD